MCCRRSHVDKNQIDEMLREVKYTIGLEFNKYLNPKSNITDLNIHQFVDVYIYFKYKSMISVNSAVQSNKSISRSMFERFFTGCTALSSSIVRDKVYLFIDEARNESAANLENKIQDGSIISEAIAIIRNRQLKKEISAIDGQNDLCVSYLDNMRLHLDQNKTVKKLPVETEAAIFKLLAAHFTEDEVVDKLKIAYITGVINT